MRGREGLPQARRSLAHTSALRSELLEAKLELGGHVVERVAHTSELVSAAGRNAPREVPARDRAGRVGQLLQRVHDRPSERVREDRDGRQRQQRKEDESLAQTTDGRIDVLLRRETDERCRSVARQKPRPDHSVALPPSSRKRALPNGRAIESRSELGATTRPSRATAN